MSDNPNKLSRFWQELKRRKVIQVITVYASASFVLIELINNVSEPLNLPQGLSTIAIVVLAVGFPFAVVLSWIFDVTPKGIEKTKPSDEIPEEEKAAAPNSWRIATYISVVVIVGLISFNLITRSSLSENLSLYGKSIAILPFINDSQDDSDEMFINGTMMSILNKLSRIKDLRVMQRESVEPYRDTIVPVEEICKKLGVSHVLRGSVRKYGDRIVISVQLIDQGNNTMWSMQDDRDINENEELFNLESKIAHEVAAKIKATITPQEELRINKVPTTDPIAIQLCLKAKSDFLEFMNGGKREYFERAKQRYQQALSIDSTYANAITGLGWIYQRVNYQREQFQETYLDSVRIYIDRALSYDSENEDAYLLQGFYYYFSCNWTASERSYNKVLEINPNNATAYGYIGRIHFRIRGDYVKAIQYFEEAEKRNRGELLTAYFYRWFGHAYFGTGFFDLAEEYLQNALAFDADTAQYFSVMGNLECAKGNFKKAAEIELKAYNKFQHLGFIGLWNLIYSEQIDEANRMLKLGEEKGPWHNPVEAGCLCLINGEKEKAEQLFNIWMNEFKKGPKHGPTCVASGNRHLEAAMIYAYRGQKDSSYIYLDELLEMKNSLQPSVISHLEINPMFDEIREKERFQKILRKVQADYQAAHERMRLHLKETGRL